MNREIKFRAWDEENKTMHDLVGFLSFKEFTEIHYGASGYKIFQPNKIVLLQYTSLKDKNDKEIYKGDIISIKYARSSEDIENCVDNRTPCIGFVTWDEYSTGWIIETRSPLSSNGRGTVMTSIICNGDGEREVIGNIYEHKHLLE